MNQQEQIAIYNELDAEIIEICKKKGADYANTDVLSNFKKVQQVLELLEIDPKRSPTDQALHMVVLKMCRIGNLLTKGTAAKNEPLEDSFKDGINYFKLAYLCEKDKPQATLPAPLTIA